MHMMNYELFNANYCLFLNQPITIKQQQKQQTANKPNQQENKWNFKQNFVFICFESKKMIILLLESLRF